MSGKAQIDEYIRQFPKSVQTILRKIRKVTLEAVPGGEEAIVYKIPTIKLEGKNLVHFAGHTKHIGFYPTPSCIQKFKREIAAYKSSKGSVQFPVDQPIPYDLVRRMIDFRVKEIEGAG